MSYFEVFLLGVALSMDAFSVAVGKGLGMKKIRWGDAFLIALFFGGFQALMPAAGYALGTGFSFFVQKYAPWITFALLLFIGGKMILDAIRGEEPKTGAVDLKELFILAVATSLDAMASGIVFAAEGMTVSEMLPRILLIGGTTFALSLLGVLFGNVFGARYNRPATAVGGVVLIGIGLKILLEALFG